MEIESTHSQMHEVATSVLVEGVNAGYFAYFLLPETKNLTLEELDVVFNVGNREHAKYYMEALPWYMEKYVLRKDVPPMEPLCQVYDDEAGETMPAGNEKATV